MPTSNVKNQVIKCPKLADYTAFLLENILPPGSTTTRQVMRCNTWAQAVAAAGYLKENEAEAIADYAILVRRWPSVRKNSPEAYLADLRGALAEKSEPNSLKKTEQIWIAEKKKQIGEEAVRTLARYLHVCG